TLHPVMAELAPDVRQHIATALGGLADSAWTHCCDTYRELQREAVVAEVAESFERLHVFWPLIPAFSTSAHVRIKALEAIARMMAVEAVPLVITQLAEVDDPELMNAAADCLVTLRHLEGYLALKQFSKRVPSPRLRRARRKLRAVLTPLLDPAT